LLDLFESGRWPDGPLSSSGGEIAGDVSFVVTVHAATACIAVVGPSVVALGTSLKGGLKGGQGGGQRGGRRGLERGAGSGGLADVVAERSEADVDGRGSDVAEGNVDQV
jgi:hypothetical protein